MKKYSFILPLALFSSLLVSCGAKTLSEVDGIALAKKIQAFRADSSFAYKTDKFTYSINLSGDSMGNGTSKIDARIIKGEYIYYNLVSSMSKKAQNETVYVYSKDGIHYFAEDDGTNKTYSELSQSAFDAALESNTSGIRNTVIAMADGVYESLSNFTEASSSSSANSQTSTTSTYSFASSGDGNLVVTWDTTEKDSETNATSHEVITFDHYYPVSVSEVIKGTRVSSSSSTSLDGEGTMNFAWDTCSPFYPDLSKYTKQ